MQLNKIGLFLLTIAMLLPWVWLPGMAKDGNSVALFSQYLGMTALITMATSQLIATRWIGIEKLFGPLDQSYRLHKWMGLWALAATFLHDTIDADIEGVGKRTTLGEIAETAGEIGLNGMLILVLITVATFIPYHLWKWTHRLIGVFFILSAFHYLFIERPFTNAHPLGLYMGLICLLGLIAYAYTSAPRRFRPSRAYTVEKLEKQGDALVVNLAPEQKSLRHRAGQFAFISFSELGMGEPHPFTLSAAPTDSGHLRMSIGPLGDYTIRLMSRLQVGASARVEGPFGDFALVRGAQVWVAAGIGITPFAAMAGSLTMNDGPVTLFYSVKDRSQAAHLKELEAVAVSNPNFKLALWETNSHGRLSAETIVEKVGDFKDKHLLYCGPATFRNSLWNELRNHGLSARRFHYELFEIRTGIGMDKLLQFLVNRYKQKQ